MHPTRAKKRTGSLILAAVLALALPASAFAASTSSTVTESLTVAASISMTGIPASLDYGSSTAGTNVVAPEFTAAVSSNNASGWSVAVNATDLTNGGGTIPATNRQYSMAGSGYTATGGGSPVSYPGGDFVIANRATPGSANVFVTSRISIPAAASPGAYTGSAVFTASTNP